MKTHHFHRDSRATAFLIILSLAALAGLPATAQTRTIAVLNPGFESPDPYPSIHTDNLITSWIGTSSAPVSYGVLVSYRVSGGLGARVGYAQEGAIYQVLGESVQANTRYTLSLKAGYSHALPYGEVQLRAGGSVLAASSVPTGGYGLGNLTLVYRAGTNDPHQGLPLEIRLIDHEPSHNTSVYGDGVSLTAEPATCDATWGSEYDGLFATAPNWSTGMVPGPEDIVCLESEPDHSKNRAIILNEPPMERRVEGIEIRAGTWTFDFPLWEGAGGTVFRSVLKASTVQIDSDASLTVHAGFLNSSQLRLETGSRLAINGGEVRTRFLSIGDGATLSCDGGELFVDGSLDLRGTSNKLRIELHQAMRGSEQAMITVGDGFTFRAGGKLQFVLGEDYSAPAAGDRFRLIKFTTEEKEVGKIYDNFRFKDYDCRILNADGTVHRDDLIWGLAYRQDSISGAQFIEILVMRKPQRVGGSGPLSKSNKSDAALVLVTHGTYSQIGLSDGGAFGEIAGGIKNFLVSHYLLQPRMIRWEVATYDWREYATSAEEFTYNAATSAQVGIGLGESLVHWMDSEGISYRDMHLLSHSSGSWLINRIMQLKAPETAIHLSMFDAFVNPAIEGAFPFGGRFIDELGSGAGTDDHSEHYVDASFIQSPPGTHYFLKNAVNFDVTRAVINSPPGSSPHLDTLLGVLGPYIYLVEAHQWPYQWYLETIRLANGDTQAAPGLFCAGFSLSPEYREANPSHPVVFSSKVITQDGCDSPWFINQSEDYEDGFVNSSTGPAGEYSPTSGGGIKMTTGSESAPIANSPRPKTNGPDPSGGSWAAVTNHVFLQYTTTDMQFVFQFPTNSAGGLWVSVDETPVAMFDQALYGTNLQSSGRITFDPPLASGSHDITFLLLAPAGETSSVLLQELAFAYGKPPEIIAGPESASATGGQPLSLNVVVSSIPPLTYQWRKDGANLVNSGFLSGATGAQLSFAHALPSDAANYDVVVGNIYGSVTSQLATVTLDASTFSLIGSGGFTNESFTMPLIGTPSSRWSILRLHTVPGTWQPIGSVLLSAEGSGTFADTNPPPSQAVYQAAEDPTP